MIGKLALDIIPMEKLQVPQVFTALGIKIAFLPKSTGTPSLKVCTEKIFVKVYSFCAISLAISLFKAIKITAK